MQFVEKQGLRRHEKTHQRARTQAATTFNNMEAATPNNIQLSEMNQRPRTQAASTFNNMEAATPIISYCIIQLSEMITIYAAHI